MCLYGLFAQTFYTFRITQCFCTYICFSMFIFEVMRIACAFLLQYFILYRWSGEILRMLNGCQKARLKFVFPPPTSASPFSIAQGCKFGLLLFRNFKFTGNFERRIRLTKFPSLKQKIFNFWHEFIFWIIKNGGPTSNPAIAPELL